MKIPKQIEEAMELLSDEQTITQDELRRKLARLELETDPAVRDEYWPSLWEGFAVIFSAQVLE